MGGYQSLASARRSSVSRINAVLSCCPNVTVACGPSFAMLYPNTSCSLVYVPVQWTGDFRAPVRRRAGRAAGAAGIG